MSELTLAEYQSTARYVDVNGQQIAYWQTGKGPDVWFLHGFPSATWDWHHQWEALAPDFCCHGFDFLGFGLSAKPHPHQYSVLEQADICEQVMAHAGVTSATLVAHDYGVSIAQELLSRQVRGDLACDLQQIVYLNGGLFVDVQRPLLTQKLLHGPLGPLFARFMSKRTLASGFRKIFAPTSPPTQHTIDILWQLIEMHNGKRVVPSLLKYLDERVTYKDKWLQAMRQTRIPQSFINGIHDPISGQHMLDAFIERVPQGKGIPLDAGHYPQIEQPDQVTTHLINLLRAPNRFASPA